MEKKIEILKNGPYKVSGDIPLIEKQIKLVDNEYKIVKSKDFVVQNNYLLCRCGKSKNMPFCDSQHSAHDFTATQKHVDKKFFENTKVYEGKHVALFDMEELCAFARVCHSNMGDVWDLVEDDFDEENLKKAIELAWDCPAGRLVIFDKQLQKIVEPKFEPTLEVLQDTTRNCIGPIAVKGNITIVNDDNKVFEKRNRVTLCRCGKTKNSPYCDASHLNT